VVVSKQRGKRSSEEAAKTRQAILDIALISFSENGFDKTSLRDIAERAGVSHGILRHHFGSKMALWQEVVSQAFDYFEERMLPLVLAGKKGNAYDALRRVVIGFIDISLSKPEFARLFVRESQSDNERSRYCRQRFQSLHGAIETLFSQAQTVAPGLRRYTNDSFFYCLMSLTYFRLVFPQMGPELKHPVSEVIPSQKDLILDLLLPT